MNPEQPVTFLIVGAGSRGMRYAEFAAANPKVAKLVGVAEPRTTPRSLLEDQHQLAAECVFEDWKHLAEKEKFADAVIISTLDALHAESAIAFANKGYHILLEKPMAPSLDQCEQIVESVKANNVIFAVGHVLLYSNYTRKIKELLLAGAIGKIVTVQHLEPVGYWHQAHSFVRGNWRNESESCSMLLAKSCHDLDWIRHVVDQPCVAVSSFGNLNHFKKEEKPVEAGDAMTCSQCQHEPNCCYSAKKLYLGNVNDGNTGWPVDVVTFDATTEGVAAALESGPYGRCVYECDNDVVDAQVVNMQFAGGVTVSFTMTAFTSAGPRRTSIFGTQGEILGDGSTITVNDFLTGKMTTYETEVADSFELGPIASGDNGLMQAFFSAVANGDPQQLLSGPDETLGISQDGFCSGASSSRTFCGDDVNRQNFLKRAWKNLLTIQVDLPSVGWLDSVRRSDRTSEIIRVGII